MRVRENGGKWFWSAVLVGVLVNSLVGVAKADDESSDEGTSSSSLSSSKVKRGPINGELNTPPKSPLEAVMQPQPDTKLKLNPLNPKEQVQIQQRSKSPAPKLDLDDTEVSMTVTPQELINESKMATNETNVQSESNRTLEEELIAGLGDLPEEIVKSPYSVKPPIARAMQIEIETTEAELDEVMLKWGLIAVLIAVPILLLPILFLFTRSRGQPEKPNMVKLDQSVTLLPTVRPDDAYLHEYASRPSQLNVVQVNSETGSPYYYLPKETGVMFQPTGQLFHPPSGVLFNPVPGFMHNPLGAYNVHIESGRQCDPLPSHVYNQTTNELYERCLAMAYDIENGCFFLPPEVNAPNEAAAVRRIKPEELPEELGEIYASLLCGAQGSQPQTGGGGVPSVTPKHNPLLIDELDANKPTSATFRETPRSAINQAAVMKLFQQKANEPSKYMDAASQVLSSQQ